MEEEYFSNLSEIEEIQAKVRVLFMGEQQMCKPRRVHSLHRFPYVVLKLSPGHFENVPPKSSQSQSS